MVRKNVCPKIRLQNHQIQLQRYAPDLVQPSSVLCERPDDHDIVLLDLIHPVLLRLRVVVVVANIGQIGVERL